MKISVILTFLLSWSFVSSNPHYKKSYDKSASKLNDVNNRESKNAARKESTDKASSGKDWGGITLNYLSQKDLDEVNKNDNADTKLPTSTLISRGSEARSEHHETIGGIKKVTKPTVSKNKLSDNSLFDKSLPNNDNNGNIITLAKRFMNEDYENAGSVLKTKEPAPADEKTKKHGVRVKRDSKTSGSNPHKGTISDHILKLSEGSQSNVLKSEKATVAEALNGRAAIQKILARAQVKAAKAAHHKMLYDNDNDFSKWLVSGASFDMDIFNHPHRRQSFDEEPTEEGVEPIEHYEIEDTDDSPVHRDHREFYVPYRVSNRPIDRHYRYGRKYKFNMPYDSTEIDTDDTDDSYRRLWYKSKYGEHRSPESWITSGEEHGRGTNRIFRKPMRHTHGSLFYEDTENAGPRHAFSYAHAPRTRFHVREDEMAGSDVPIWQYAKSRNVPIARGSRRSHAAKSRGFEMDSKEREEYNKRFLFRTRSDNRFEREDTSDERIRTGDRIDHRSLARTRAHGRRMQNDPDDEIADSRENAELSRKQYYYDIRNRERSAYGKYDAAAFENNRHFDSVEHSSSFDHEENIRNKNKFYNADGVQHFATSSTSAEMGVEGVEENQLDDTLISRTSAGAPTRKAVNSDIERYHLRDQNADPRTSFSSSSSDEKGENKYTNNVLALPSVNDGSAAVERKTENDYSVRGGTETVINNDATSGGIEMEIKNHPPTDSPLAHSTLSRSHPETHQEDWDRTFNGYQHSTADTVVSSKTKHSMRSGKDERLKRLKTQGTSSMKEYENSDNRNVKENEEVNVAASAETTNSFKNEHRYDLLRTSSSSNLNDESYMENKGKYRNLKGNRGARHKTSIEVIDIEDRDAEAYIREFPVYKSDKKHVPHHINYHDFNSEEMPDDREVWFGESVEDPKKSETDYDGLEKGDEFVDNDEMSEKSIMNISSEHRTHGQRDQHRKRGKHGRHKYHGKHARHNEYGHRAFNQHVRNMTSSNALNTSKFDNWDEYLYFIRQQKEKRNRSNMSFKASAGQENRRQNNARNKEISSLDERRKIHMTNDDNYMHTKKYKKFPISKNKLVKIKNASGSMRNAHSTDRETSSKDYWEKEIESKNNMSNRSKNSTTVTHKENLIYNDSVVDMSRTSNDKETINNNDRHEQGSSNLLLENSHADTQMKNTSVYNVRNENENVDITAQQAAGIIESTDSKSNLQQTSTETSSTSQSHTNSQNNSEDYANKSHYSKKTAIEKQTRNKKMSIGSEKNRYQDHDPHKTSISSKFTDESDIEMKNYKRKESKSDREMNMEILANSSTNTMNKSRSVAQNTIASPKSSTKLQISKSKHHSNRSNKKYNEKVEAFSDAIVSVNNKEKSMSAKNSSSSKPIKKTERTEMDIENHLSDSRNSQVNIFNSESAASKSHQRHQTSDIVSSISSTKSKAKNKQKSKDVKNSINTNAEVSTTTALSSKIKNKRRKSSSNSSEKSQVETDLNGYENNQINTISKTSEKVGFSDVTNQYQSHSQRLFSSPSISSEEQRMESHHDPNNLQNNQRNVAESARKSFNNVENRDWSDSSKSLSSSKLLEETRMKNRYSSDNSTETRKNNIEYRSKLESASSSEPHMESRIEEKDYINVANNNKKDIVNSKASSGSINSVRMKGERQSKSQNMSLVSKSSAESQTKDENYSEDTKVNHKQNIDVISKAEAAYIYKNNHRQKLKSSSSLSSASTKHREQNKNAKTSKLTTFSNTLVNDINNKEGYNLLHDSSSSQTTDEDIINARKDDTQIVSNTNQSILRDITNDSYKHENNVLKAKWFADRMDKDNIEKFTNNKNIGHKISKEDSKDENSVLISIEAMNSTDVKNTQNLTTSSSTDSKIGTLAHDINQQKKGGIIIDNSMISGISGTSETSNIIENIDREESLKTSFLSDPNSTSKEKKAHDVNITQNSKESTIIAKTLGSTVLNNNGQSRNSLAKETRLSEAFTETQKRQNNFNVLNEKSEDAIKRTTMEATSSRVNNMHQDNQSTDPYEQIQADDKLIDKNRNVGNSIESLESMILQNNKHNRKTDFLKLESSYNSHNGRKNAINTETRKNLANANRINKTVSKKSAIHNNLSNMNQNSLLKMTSSNNSYTEMSQKDEHKSDILSDVNETASTEITFHDDKQTSGNISQKKIFSNNSHGKAYIKHKNNYNMSNESTAIDDKKESEENNLREITERLRAKNKDIRQVSKKDIKGTDNAFASFKAIDTNLENYLRQGNSLAVSTNTQDKQRHELINLLHTKAQSKHDNRKSSHLKKNKIINTKARNNINEWRKKFRKTLSSSSYAESEDEKERAIERKVSSSISKYKRKNDPVQKKSSKVLSNYIQTNEEDNYHHQRTNEGDTIKTKIAQAKISNSGISPTEYQNDIKKGATSAALQLKQHDSNTRQKNKLITSTMSSTKETDSRETRKMRQYLSGTVTPSKSYIETKHESINRDLKKDIDVTANAMTSTTSSRKVKNGPREKSMKELSKSDPKLKTSNRNNLNILRVEKTIGNGETSADFAVWNKFKNTLRNKSTKKNSLSHSNRDTYAKNVNRNMLRNNIANDADIKATGYDRDEYQNNLTTTSLSNSGIRTQTEHEYNSNIQQETRSSNMKGHMIESKNAANNKGAISQIASNSRAFAHATSSNNVGNIIKQDMSEMLSSVDPYTKSQTNNKHALDILKNNQEITDTQTSVKSLASIYNQEEQINNSLNKILHSDFKHRRTMKIKNDDNILKKDIHNTEGTKISRQTTGFNNFKVDRRNNLLKTRPSINSFTNAQIKNNASVLKKQHSIAADSTASSDSKTFNYAKSNNKKDLNNLIATSNNSHTKSGTENESRVNIPRKNRMKVLSASTSAQISSEFKDTNEDETFEMTLSPHSHADIETKDESSNSVKKDPRAAIKMKKKTTPFTDIKDTSRHKLFNLPASTSEIQTKDKKIFRKPLIKHPTEASSDPQIENTHNLKIWGGNYENSAIIDATGRTRSSEKRRDQREDSRETIILSDKARNQHDLIRSTSSANSYVAAQARSGDISKSKKAKEDRGAIVNESSLGKAEAYNEVKGAHSSDWLLTTSAGTGSLAEERAQNKDKFNILREAGKVAVYAGTSTGAVASDKIGDEQHNIRAENLSEHRDSSEAAKKNQNVVISSASTRIIASKNRSGNKNILDDKLNTSSFNEGYAEMQIENGAEGDTLHSSETSTDIKETRKLTASAASSAFASTSDNRNVDISAKYDNDETSATSTIDLASKKKHLPSVKRIFLHPSREISKCNNGIETRRFISEASSLYHMLDKQRGSEFLLLKKNPKGPVQVANLKTGVPPLIAYRLIPRDMYERIRSMIANKQIRYANCALSNT